MNTPAPTSVARYSRSQEAVTVTASKPARWGLQMPPVSDTCTIWSSPIAPKMNQLARLVRPLRSSNREIAATAAKAPTRAAAAAFFSTQNGRMSAMNSASQIRMLNSRLRSARAASVSISPSAPPRGSEERQKRSRASIVASNGLRR